MVSAQTVGILVGTVGVLLMFLGGNKPAEPDPRNDFLSRRFAPSGMYPTASGPQTTPFHVYSMDMIAVWCDVNRAEAEKHLAHTNFVPVLTEKDRAIASIWNYHYRDTSAGPYDEVVFIIAASRKLNADGTVAPRVRVGDSPMEWLERLMFDPDVTSYTVKLWLSEQKPVDWGRDIAGANKIKYPVTVSLPDGASGAATVVLPGAKAGDKPILELKVSAVTGFESFQSQISMLRQFSFAHLMEAVWASTMTFPVLFSRGIVTPRTRTQDVEPELSITYRNSPQPVLQYWNGEASSAVFNGEFAGLDARPRMSQRIAPGMTPPLLRTHPTVDGFLSHVFGRLGRAVLMAPHNIAVPDVPAGGKK